MAVSRTFQIFGCFSLHQDFSNEFSNPFKSLNHFKEQK